MQPSEKQVEFAKVISEELNISLPKEKTKKAYHNFISQNINIFKESVSIQYNLSDAYPQR